MDRYPRIERVQGGLFEGEEAVLHVMGLGGWRAQFPSECCSSGGTSGDAVVRNPFRRSDLSADANKLPSGGCLGPSPTMERLKSPGLRSRSKPETNSSRRRACPWPAAP